MKFLELLTLVALTLLQHHAETLKIGISKTQSNPKTNNSSDATTPANTNDFSAEVTAKTTPIAMPTQSTPTTPLTTTTTKFKFPEFPPKKPLPTKPTTRSPATTTTLTTLNSNEEPNISESMNLSNSSNVFQRRDITGYFCNCDLLMKTCDINCCCDHDCPEEALRVFDCLAETTDNTKVKRLFNDFKYQHSLPSCKINEGWLCVFRVNLRTDDENRMLSHQQFDTSRAFKWINPSLENTVPKDPATLDHYRFEQPLELMNQAKMQIEEFVLPFAYTPPHCHLLEPIKYLKDFKSSCLITSLENLQNHRRRLNAVVTQTKLLMRPSETFYTDSEILPTENLFEFQVHKCTNVESSMECVLLSAEEWNSTSEFNEYENTYEQQITFKILHNFTHPLGGILLVHESELASLDNIAVWQEFTVEYYYRNKTQLNAADFQNLNHKQPRTSGPLGYLQGQPLILTNFVQQENTNDNRILSYFHDSNSNELSQHTLRIFTKQGGLCSHSNDAKQSTINYGINTFKQCKVRLDQLHSTNNMTTEITMEQQNYTALCSELQQMINRQLLGYANANMSFETMSQLLVSKLGKPENNTEQWLQIQLKQSYDEYEPIVGELLMDSATFICRNMLITATYEFQIGQFMVNNVRHQSVVRHARLDMGQYHNLEFDLNELIEVPISLTVMYYDLNSVVQAAADNAGIIKILYVLQLCFISLLMS